MLRTELIPLSYSLDVDGLTEVTSGNNFALAAQQERLLLIPGASDLQRLITDYDDASEPVRREDQDSLPCFRCTFWRLIHCARVAVRAIPS